MTKRIYALWELMSVANSQIVKHVKKSKLRNAEYYSMQDTFDDLYARSKIGSNFNNLMGIISSTENIKLAYRNIKRNTGSKNGRGRWENYRTHS